MKLKKPLLFTGNYLRSFDEKRMLVYARWIRSRTRKGDTIEIQVPESITPPSFARPVVLSRDKDCVNGTFNLKVGTVLAVQDNGPNGSNGWHEYLVSIDFGEETLETITHMSQDHCLSHDQKVIGVTGPLRGYYDPNVSGCNILGVATTLSSRNSSTSPVYTQVFECIRKHYPNKGPRVVSGYLIVDESIENGSPVIAIGENEAGFGLLAVRTGDGGYALVYDPWTIAETPVI